MKQSIKLSAAFTALLLLSCQQSKSSSNPNQETNSSIQLNRADSSFDSRMSELVVRQHYKPDITPPGQLKYHMVYDLKKRLYLPEFYNLTFDLRKYNQSSHNDITVLHVYNDSIQHVLPFINVFHKNDQSVVNGTKALGEEINSLIESLKLKQQYEVSSLLDVIMSMYSNKRLESEIDIKVYEMRGQKFLKEGSFPGNCKSDIENNLSLISKMHIEPNAVIYGGDMPNFIFTINNLLEINVEHLDYDGCDYKR